MYGYTGNLFYFCGMNWIDLTTHAALDALITASQQQPQVIFKHSTRCSISTMAKARLERTYQPIGANFFYLDLLRHRDISDKIAEHFHVHHESPQILVIKNGVCVYTESHSGINMDDIEEQVAA
ncbi:MAG: hypothetical protein RLZZ316_2334 [Bacteroidota bacterium]|jgi:bacillithiol system protein YtxJ